LWSFSDTASLPKAQAICYLAAISCAHVMYSTT
jgi:hypothetical protein